MVEDCVDEDGRMTIASVLTEVTVTVTSLEEVEDVWEEHKTDRERKMSKEINAILQTSVKVVQRIMVWGLAEKASV